MTDRFVMAFDGKKIDNFLQEPFGTSIIKIFENVDCFLERKMCYVNFRRDDVLRIIGHNY